MTPERNTITVGDALEVLRSWPDGFVQCVVTSPPYWGLRSLRARPDAGRARCLLGRDPRRNIRMLRARAETRLCPDGVAALENVGRMW